MIRVGCFSDFHGILPPKPKIDCDLVIVAGDLCPEVGIIKQTIWLENSFYQWIQQFPRAVWIAGNHDRAIYHSPTLICFERHGPKYYYLQDSGCEPLPGLKVWGTPWALPYGDYVFYGDETFIGRQLTGVPEDTHILVSHGPPHGRGDWTLDGRNAGSRSLFDLIEKQQPELVVCGHLHDARGVYRQGKSTIINAAVRPIFLTMTEDYVIRDIYT